jgi:hypothetical protein
VSEPLSESAPRQRAEYIDRRSALIYKLLVAHQSDPTNFRHEFSIDFIGSEDSTVVEDLVAILNGCQFRDCIFKIDEEPTSDNIKVAAAQAGAGEINSPQLSDNGPAHQIAVLPLAGSPSDNTSHAKMSVTPCESCKYRGEIIRHCLNCNKYSNYVPA